MFEFSIYNIIYLLLTTHITILTVTIYLHRCVSHRSLTMSKPLEHFFRFWAWLTTGQSTREWAAVHRKHHAKCEQEEDPHSPKIYGVWNILFKGVMYYRKEAKNSETIERYGKLTPNDNLEKFYQKNSIVGLTFLFLFNVILFGWHGIWMYLIQIAWIPFWAAGVVNGIAHHKGYRNFSTNDESRNISPWGIIIGGEELHNNHHANPASAKLSVKWYEFDIGWLWIKILSYCKLLKINNVYYLPKENNNFNISEILKHRLYIDYLFKKYTFNTVWKSIKNNHYLPKKEIKYIFYTKKEKLNSDEQQIMNELLKSHNIATIYHIKEDLLNLWDDKKLSIIEVEEKYHQMLEKIKNIKQNCVSRFAKKLENTFSLQV